MWSAVTLQAEYRIAGRQKCVTKSSASGFFCSRLWLNACAGTSFEVGLAHGQHLRQDSVCVHNDGCLMASSGFGDTHLSAGHCCIAVSQALRYGVSAAFKPIRKCVCHVCLAAVLNPLLLDPYCPDATVPGNSHWLQRPCPCVECPCSRLILTVKICIKSFDCTQKACTKRVYKVYLLYFSVHKPDSPMYTIREAYGGAWSVPAERVLHNLGIVIADLECLVCSCLSCFDQQLT